MRKNEIAAPPSRIWVVAADAARARIFRAGRRDGGLTEIEDLLNPDARDAGRSRRTDRLGHAANAARGGGHSLQRNADEPRQVLIEFGQRLARRLTDARRRGEFDRVYLVAEPRLLGVVRDGLDRATRKLLAGAVAKDVSRRGAATIRQRLPERL
jgi:protein required for attachment to host cells